MGKEISAHSQGRPPLHEPAQWSGRRTQGVAVEGQSLNGALRQIAPHPQSSSGKLPRAVWRHW